MITRTVLIVEDETSFALSFQHILKRSLEYNYQITSVTSAEDALQAIRKEGRFDVILLDYFLPGINGAEFLKTLRSNDQETVVVVISASQDYKIVHDVFKLGADDFITKEELSNAYVLEKSILAGLEKKEYQKEIANREVARQRLDAITTLIRTIHHELNNPLAIINLVMAKLLSSPQLTEETQKGYLKEIRENVDRMSDILRKLPKVREQMYNKELRGLKLFALPDEPESPKEP
jgi:CheY-like chemotaxis protein